jgi:hypothetical protein
MTAQQLHSMLGSLDDTRELVLDAPQADEDHPLFTAWLVAERRAARALAAWRTRSAAPVEAYAAYRAAADEADAAQDVLASSSRRFA